MSSRNSLLPKKLICHRCLCSRSGHSVRNGLFSASHGHEIRLSQRPRRHDEASTSLLPRLIRTLSCPPLEAPFPTLMKTSFNYWPSLADENARIIQPFLFYLCADRPPSRILELSGPLTAEDRARCLDGYVKIQKRSYQMFPRSFCNTRIAAGNAAGHLKYGKLCDDSHCMARFRELLEKTPQFRQLRPSSVSVKVTSIRRPGAY